MTRLNTPMDPPGKAPAPPIPAAQPLLPPLRTVSVGAPLRWLGAGWADLAATRFVGVFYGACFAAMGWMIAAMYAGFWKFTMGLTASFFLLGPFVCCGVYWLSRQRERGEKPSLGESLTCWSRNPKSIGFFAAILTFVVVIWARISVITFALFSTHDFPTVQGMLAQIFTFGNLEFIAVWFGVGFIFASLVFAVSVVAVPMMLDRGTDTMIAIFTSFASLARNPLPLYLWAALIVALIGSSLVAGFWPLLLTAPWIGHATWHAYRDLVGEAPATL